jgi:hypothetical protein
VSIDPVTTTNGSPITTYNIMIDDGLGGSFVELKGLIVPSLTLIGTKATGVIASRYYRVKYRAANAVGFGSYSDIAYILAASIPITPSAPIITIVGTNTKI